MAAGKRSYDGPALDATYQAITEAPHWQGEGETVAVVDDAPVGEQTTEGVDVPEAGDGREGQTTWADWEVRR